MKNINRPEYDVNQIASFITENADEIIVPEKPTNPMPPRFAGKVNPDGTPRGMARTDLDSRKSLHQRRREYKAAQEAKSQTGQGMGDSGQYSGSFEYQFEEFEKDGELYSGTLVVDTNTEGEYDEDGGASYAVSAEGFKGINNFQRQDPNTGEYIDIDTGTPEGQDIMTKVGMSIIHEEPEHDSTENDFGLALRDHEASNDRSPNDYMD
jgi:hypothetical protein